MGNPGMGERSPPPVPDLRVGLSGQECPDFSCPCVGKFSWKVPREKQQ